MTVLRRTRATAAGHQDGAHVVPAERSGGLVKRRTSYTASSSSVASTPGTTAPSSTLFKKKRSAGDTAIAEVIVEDESSKKEMANSSSNSSTSLRKGKAREKSGGEVSIAVLDDSPATSSVRSARSSSRRRHARGGQDEDEEDEQLDGEQPPPIQVHEVSDNVLQAQGLASISTSLIDNLPDCSFPKKGISLHPSDLNDPLLILCGKVLASVSNRALTPKEIALILARRHGWQFNGSQPFAVVSSCIRSHVRRASLAQPPYHPIFTPYELSSVPPVEDIPCLGIEADSKPVVKRGTFWFLSESMGYGYPFPHRRAAANTKGMTSASSQATSISPATSSSSTSLSTSSAPTPQPPQSHHRRSSLRHQPQPIAPAQPIPIMPAPPQPQSISTSFSPLPTLAPRRQSDGKTDRLTRAQKAQSTFSTEQNIPPIPTTLAQSAPVSSNILDQSKAIAGKRKRTISKALSSNVSSTVTSDAATTIAYPHLQQLPEGANAAAQPNNQAGATAKNASSRKGSMSKRGAAGGSAVHRRAFSSSAGDGVSAKPIPALRKLKLRLSAVSESAVLDDTSSASDMSLLSSSLPPSNTIKPTTKKVTLAGKPSSTKQSKNKRARTQSMSSLHTTTTASFPFDDLHLYHSMQQQSQQASPSASSNYINGEGTLYPFEMHMQLPPSSGVDMLLTSRSAPGESNLFSPTLAAAAAAAANATQAQHIAGPFSRSHSPSASLHHYLSGRRSLPPPSEFGNEDESEHLELEYDGWGMDSDHCQAGGRDPLRGSTIAGEEGSEDMEDSFHEAMLKNDELDFEFDFSLGSLGQSASRLISNSSNADESNFSLEEEDQHQESSDGKTQQGRRSMSILEALAVDSVLDSLEYAGEESHETVKGTESRKGKRPSLSNRRSSSGTAGDFAMEGGDQLPGEEEYDDEQELEDKEAGPSSVSRIAQIERKAYERALNTTLCPAAAKLGDGSSKSARLRMKRFNSSSSLTFSRSNNPSLRILSDLPNDNSAPSSASSPIRSSSGSGSAINPLLRPPSVSRMNSRDALTSAVPLVELPSIPLEDSRRDSFLFYHLTSEADPPSYFGGAYRKSAKNDGQEAHASTHDERDDASDAASDSSAASSSSSILAKVIKSEEEVDEMTDMQVDDDEGSHDDDECDTTQRETSRCGSTASAISHAEVESNDSFNPEMIYPLVGRRAPSADLGNIEGQGELDEVSQEVQLHNIRSQSSSRTTSLSPRDSFSPHLAHHGGSYSSEVDADWALTPPSEEEHVDEDEKNLDRATMLGLESVGMEDLDDVWPGVRRSLGGVRTGQNLEAQVDGVTCDFKVMEVFEPVLSAAPIPQSDIPSPHLFTLPTLISSKNATGEEADETVTTMEIDQTPMDEHTAAAMFIADESLHPPKPAPVVTITAATSEAGELDTLQPSLSPVSAATRDATTTADAQAPTSSAVDVMQQENSAAAANGVGRDSTTPTQQLNATKQQASVQQQSQQQGQPASTQSFLFYPEKPFHPEISILLTDTKILFYSTIVNVPKDGRPLLRRVDNDAVDAEALLLSLEGCGGIDSDRIETLRKIKELGNTWVSLDFARELLNKFGGVDPLLGIFLADDILLAWNEKLVKLGSMLRQKNGLPTPVAGAAGVKKEEKNKNHKLAKEALATPSTSTAIVDKAVAPKKSKSSATVSQKKKKEEGIEAIVEIKTVSPPAAKSKGEIETPPVIPSSSSPPKKEKVKTNLARRASSRIKSTGS